MSEPGSTDKKGKKGTVAKGIHRLSREEGQKTCEERGICGTAKRQGGRRAQPNHS